MKYPDPKKWPDTVEDILFRLNFSPTRKRERDVGRILAVFEKPFVTLNMDSAVRSEFTDVIARLKAKSDEIRASPKNRSLHKEFWVIWKDFDTVLHKIGERSAVAYCLDLIQNLHQQILGTIEQVAAQKPVAQLEASQHLDVSTKMSQAFKAVDDRFRTIVCSQFADAQKIAELEAMRKQVRQFKTDISAAFLRCFKLCSASRSSPDSFKVEIEKALSLEVAAISDLRRQAFLIESLDEFIEQSLRTVTRLIKGQPLSTSRQNCSGENVDLTSPFFKPDRGDVCERSQILMKAKQLEQPRPKNDDLATPRKVRIGRTTVIGPDPAAEPLAEPAPDSPNPLTAILEEIGHRDSPVQLADVAHVNLTPPPDPSVQAADADASETLELNGALIRCSMLLNVALSYRIKKGRAISDLNH
jgi:hypothetical protein